MSQKFQVDLPIIWSHAHNIRQQVAGALAGYSETLRSSSVMAASELSENALRYGVAVPALPLPRLSFGLTPESIELQVCNGLTDLDSLARVQRMIERMQPAGACEQLYLERLQELAAQPVEPNRLGLYRIGHEGKFTLACSYADRVLTLHARRPLVRPGDLLFSNGKLAVEVSLAQEEYGLRWRGVCDFRDANEALSPVLNTIIHALRGRRLVLDFRPLSFMNSASVIPLLVLVKAICNKGGAVHLIYNAELPWQRSQASSMHAIAQGLKRLTIEP